MVECRLRVREVPGLIADKVLTIKRETLALSQIANSKNTIFEGLMED